MKAQILNVVSELRPFGLGEQAALIAPKLSEHFAVDFFCASRGSRDHCGADLPGQWYEYELGGRNWLGALRHLVVCLRSNRYELIHSWGDRATELVRWARLCAGRRARAARWFAHLDEETCPSSFHRGFGLSSPSAIAAETWLANKHAHLDVIPLPLVAPLPALPHRDLRFRLNLPDGVRLIGTMCPLETRFGLKHLIWCLDQLKCVRADIRLVVWGAGSQSRQLRRFARQVTVHDWIYWLRPNADLRSAFAGLDLYWHAPRADATPGALIAALTAGLPAIAPLSPATRDLEVYWPNTLKVVTWGARDEIARQTHQWLERGLPTPVASPMAAWTQLHSPSAVAKEYLAAYLRLLGT